MRQPNENRNQHLPFLTSGGVLQVVAAGLWFLQAWILAKVIGVMAADKMIWPLVLFSALLIVILGLVRYTLEAYGSRLSFLNARQTLTRLRADALKSLSFQSPLDKQRPVSGVAASIISEQAEAIVPYLSRYQPVQLKAMVIPSIIFLAVFFQSWLAAIILLGVVPLIPLFTRLIGYNAQKASQNQIQEIGLMNGFLLDRLRGLATIRAFDAIDTVASRLTHIAHTVKQKTMSVLKIAFLSSAVVELFSAIGVAMVAYYIGFHLLGQDLQFGTWGTRLTLSQGMFILLLTPAFFEPLRELSAVWHERAAGTAAIMAMNQLSQQGLTSVGEINNTHNNNTLLHAQPLSVRIDKVSFRYPETEKLIFKNFSLNISAGEKLALTAPSGAGKSTLLSLIAGLIPVTEGSIKIGDLTLTDQTANSIRSRIGWVGQSGYVFSGTLLDNITMKRTGISEAQVQSALSSSALISRTDLQLNRHLEEGGQGLSGGELLRMALARAMLTPELGLLLIDEPTAHLDELTAKEVIQNLIAISQQGVTLIIATHDSHLLPLMDRVISLPLGEAYA